MLQLFFGLLVAGLLLIGIEMFVPGGVVGALGVLALLGAIILSFPLFGQYGILVTLGILVLLGVSTFLWLKVFPKTRLGQRMASATDLAQAKGTDPALSGLAGTEGVALSDLRPAGFAELGGRRVDVVTMGQMISKGTRVRVLQVEGNRVVVGRSAEG